MPRIRSRRSAPAAPIPDLRTPRTWRGSSIACCGERRRRACSTATISSAAPRRTRTSANPPARPISWRRTRTRRRGCARRCCRSPGKPSSASAWSMAGGSRCRRSMTTPLSTADGDAWRGGPRPGASMPDAPVAGARGRADLSDRCLHQGRNEIHVAGVWQWRRAATARWTWPRSAIGGNDGLVDSAGLAATALRRRARHRLSAAARRLCRGAVPASDPRGGSTPRWRVPPATN